MLFNVPPTKLSTDTVIDIINNTQEQVITKGTIDPESQVSCETNNKIYFIEKLFVLFYV